MQSLVIPLFTDTRVPMMIRAPWKARAAGARTAALVEHVDLYPSLARTAARPIPRSLLAGLCCAHVHSCYRHRSLIRARVTLWVAAVT